MTNSALLSARYATVARASVYAHREQDSEFAKMWDEAVEQALDLLHSRVFQRCIEGDLEPIMYMGVVVDYVRKFDSRLQIEMLRAKRPESFKTPGVNVNVGTKGDVFVLTEEQRHVLMDYNRQWLLDHPPPDAGAACPDHNNADGPALSAAPLDLRAYTPEELAMIADRAAAAPSEASGPKSDLSAPTTYNEPAK